jgi:hypothetical protein
MDTLIVDRIREVISAPYLAYPNRWMVLDEFPLEPGIRRKGTPRIDVLVVSCNGHGPIERIAYEIKTSRQDFFHELKHPEKRERVYAVCDHYWFAAPVDLVKPGEVPPECGLIEVFPNASAPLISKRPKTLKPDKISSEFMMDLARRAYQIGQRHGASICAFERFDMLTEMAHMLIRNKATAKERKTIVMQMARAIGRMQRGPEAEELARVACGEKPSGNYWQLRRRLGSVKAS